VSPELIARLYALPVEEQRVAAWVLDRVVAGLELGLRQYGPLDLAHDQRDFGAEASAELRDGLVYLACLALRGHRP
jgi:hypothetical protein